MQKFKWFLYIITLIVFSSCEKDNYDGPTAGLSGRFIDAQTGELVPQDIIRGTQIEIVEHGYGEGEKQYLTVKNDGTYDNSLLFENMYTIQPVRGNFIPVEPQDFRITKGSTLDFTVTPYLRVRDANIALNGTKVVATFKLDQNVTTNVKKIGLYAHSDSRVGEPMRLVAAEQDINGAIDPDQVYTLEIDLPANSSQLKPGNNYYFRAGAVIDNSEAKFNYSPTVRIAVN
jgi:hypothetical protein